MKAKRLLCILALVSSAFGLLRAQGRNVCFEAGTPGGNASSAEIYSGIEKGGFRPGYSSSDFWRAGASAKTRGRFGKSFMTGSFSFEELHGKDMMTSMFINPGYYPIDVLEFTPGDKTLQSYRFDGGIAHPLGEAWSFGGRVGFVSQNYAKRKDLRHTNYGLDFSVVPSMLYRIDGRQRLGLSLVFRKTSESIEAEQVGAATADTYYAFFDKGLRYGTYQAWDGSGIHLAEAGVNRLPVREYSYGAALQYGYGAFYVDAEYLRTSGLVGEKGYDWYRFPGHKLAANLSFQHRVPGVCGGARLTVHVDWRGQRLEEAAWDKVTSGGITLPEVYGYNTVSRRRQLNLMPSWQLSFNHLALRSVRVAYAGIIMDEHASPQYPYTDRWHLWMSRLELTAVTGLPFGGIGKRFTLTLGARGFWANDSGQGLEAGEAGVEPAAAPFRLSGDWIRKHEYMTSSGLGLNGSLAYAFHAVRGLSLSVDASWTHAFEIEYLLGKNRWTGNLHLGYAF